MEDMIALSQDPAAYAKFEPLLPPECYGPPPEAGEGD